eukprot:1503579-Amphidinium_carterae.1
MQFPGLLGNRHVAHEEVIYMHSSGPFGAMRVLVQWSPQMFGQRHAPFKKAIHFQAGSSSKVWPAKNCCIGCKNFERTQRQGCQ